MMRSLYDPPIPVSSPVLPPEQLRVLARQMLDLSSADIMSVRIDHLAAGVARVARGRVRLTQSGDTLWVQFWTTFGKRVAVNLTFNQLDPASIRQAVQYLDRVAREQPGDPISTIMPVPPREYLPNTIWNEHTVAAFSGARHTVIPALTQPVIDAGLTSSAFVGVAVHSRLYANKQGIIAADRETDSELTVSAWSADKKGSGWAGQAARDWNTLTPGAVAEEAIRLAKLAEKPVALEPGRRTAILDRPAVAQLVRGVGRAFDARVILGGMGPLYDRRAGRPKLNERVLDPRLTLSTDPNDPEGGYLPFNWGGYPLIPMTFIKDGVFERMAYDTMFAAEQGVSPANDSPESIRLSGGETSVEEMIANCREGIYVNRLAEVNLVDFNSGTVTGVTSGGCYLVKDGKITKAVKHFRFVESPWFILNRLEALGPTRRTAFGYAPWYGNWPVAPTIVPPVMVRDFNFSAMADAV